MKKLKDSLTNLERKALFTAIMFVMLTLGCSIPCLAQEPGSTGTLADTISPKAIQSIRVINKGFEKITLIYLKSGKAAELKNGKIFELNDSLSKVFIQQYFASQPKVFMFVEHMPQFPGGQEALKKYIGENIHYPKQARENAIQGTVVVSFIVDTTGKLNNIHTVSHPLGNGLEEEAIRLVKAMPDWIPGKQNGKKVNVQYSLPVRFELQ